MKALRILEEELLNSNSANQEKYIKDAIKEIEEYINLTITEHMGKSYTVWKLKQQTEVEPDEVEKKYKKDLSQK